MRIIVQKYGGKSIGTIPDIKKVAKSIVKRHKSGEGLVVVVSAMADSTDKLLKSAYKVASKPRERELDMLLTAGERISMALLSMAIWENGACAISFTGSQSGIITDYNHTRARIVEIRANRIIEELQKNRIVIVAGFQGVSGNREITTLGRGGSDTTAVALACALGAERCEIYKNVEGVFTIDPKKYDNAKHLDEINYEVLFDMTYFGAMVVHSRAVEVARRHGVPMLLTSSIGKGKETMVNSKTFEGSKFVSVSSKERVLWITIRMKEDVFHYILKELDVLRTDLRNPSVNIENDEVKFTFWLLPDLKDDIKTIKEKFPNAEITVEELGIVAANGFAIAGRTENIEMIINRLRDKGIHFRYFGTTNRSIFVLLPREEVGAAESNLHTLLIKA